MRLVRKIWIGLIGGALFGLITIGSIAAENSYQGILERNVFGLKPPPEPTAEPQKPPEPPVKITLTGITTILGDKRALMKTPAQSKPGQPPAERYYMLAEGQREGELEVLAINTEATTVMVSYAGTVSTLSFSDNAAKSPATPPPPLAAAAPIQSDLPPVLANLAAERRVRLLQEHRYRLDAYNALASRAN